MVMQEEERKRKIEEDKLESKRKKGRRRLDSDFVHLDRTPEKTAGVRCGAAAITTTICRSNARLFQVSSLGEARLVARGIHPQLDAT